MQNVVLLAECIASECNGVALHVFIHNYYTAAFHYTVNMYIHVLFTYVPECL